MRGGGRGGGGSWARRWSGWSIWAALVCSLLLGRHHPRDVHVLSVVARLRDHEAGYIQPAPVLDVFGVHVVSGSRDLQRELVGGAEETAAAITDLHVDAEPLAPLAVDLADVNHAGKDGLAVAVAPVSLCHGRGTRSVLGRCFLAA